MCGCEDRAYELIYGLAEDGYSPRQDTASYGSNVWCFDYLVARTSDRVDTCSAEDLDAVVLSVDNLFEGCDEMCTCTYRSMVVDAGCTCNSDNCCTTTIGADSYTEQTGVKFSFSGCQAIEDEDDEVAVFLCVEGISDTQPGLVGFYGKNTYSYSCDNYQLPAFCEGADGPLEECDVQDKCLEWDVTETVSTASNAEECGGSSYEVCLWWDKDRDGCTKNDYFTEACSGDGSDTLISGWVDGDEHKMCKTVCCGESADFGVADGDLFGGGCSEYSGSVSSTRNGHSASCRYDGGMCCEMGGNDCTWSVEAPQCTPEPTWPTPKPTWPTPQPTLPTLDTTGAYDACDCYTTWIFDDNDEYLLEEGEKGYVEGEDNYKYCYVWLVRQNLRGSQASVCNDSLVGLELGVCSDPYVEDLNDIIVDYTGCDDVYANYDDELELNGLYCEIYVDPEYDPNDSKNEVVTLCLLKPMFNEFPYWEEVGYYKAKGGKAKCADTGLPDLCNTADPTSDPTTDPTNAPSFSPTNAPSRAPSVSPSHAPSFSPSTAPTNFPTADPTVDPTADPTSDPTVDPTADPTREPTDVPIQDVCCDVKNGRIEMDTLFVVDKSCLSSTADDGAYCEGRQKFLAELMTSVKGEDSATAKRIGHRVGYLEFGASHNAMMLEVDLEDAEFNHGPISVDDVQDYYNTIASFGCGLTVTPSGYTDLESALEYALDIFDARGRNNVHRKIVVVSECENTPDDAASITDICDDAEGGVLDRITSQDQYDGVDLIFVNLGAAMAADYGACLASDDVYSFDGVDAGFQDMIDVLQTPICDTPTPSPTTDPTADPTADPSADPTGDPTADPTIQPTFDPTTHPTTDPSADPTVYPTADPTADPSSDPTTVPTRSPVPSVCDEFDGSSTRTADIVIVSDVSRDLGVNRVCDFYRDGPVQAADGNLIRSISPHSAEYLSLGQTMHIRFEYDVESYCPGECSLLRVGDDAAYPAIYLAADTNGDGNSDLVIELDVWANQDDSIYDADGWPSDETESTVTFSVEDCVTDTASDVVFHSLYVMVNESNVYVEVDGEAKLSEVGQFKRRFDRRDWYKYAGSTDCDEECQALRERENIFVGDSLAMGNREAANARLKHICIETSYYKGNDADSMSSACHSKHLFMAEAITLLKGEDDDDGDGGKQWTDVRYAFIEFDGDGATEIKKLDGDYNRYPLSTQGLVDEYNDIAYRECAAGTDGETDLCAALEMALDHFDDEVLGSDRELKLAIFSHSQQLVCSDGEGICSKFEERLKGISVVMFNFEMNDTADASASDYLACLTMYDDGRRIELTTERLQDGEDRDYYLEEGVRENWCDHVPTAAPTTDPTRDPTRDPTADPTRDPTSDPTADPTADPTFDPTAVPTADPTVDPTGDPTRDPTADPTVLPTADPTRDPSSDPTVDPTANPTTDPTRDPTADPTVDPTRDPTADPTVDPTADPTGDPTGDPTSDPTADPTRDPTVEPTESPIHKECYMGYELDIAFLVDHSCGFTESECAQRQDGITELITSIKNDNTPRLMYLKVDSTSYGNLGDNVLLSLNDSTMNGGDSDAASDGLQDLLATIRGDDCGGSSYSAPNMWSAILWTVNEFESLDDSAERNHKIVVISSCEEEEWSDPCDLASDVSNMLYVGGDKEREVEVVVINVGSEQANYPKNYLQCLTEDDEGRYFELDSTEHSAFQDIVTDFNGEVCTEPTVNPTPEPTADPTEDPSRDPTADPTADPSVDPTADPTRDPTVDPTADPTGDPIITARRWTWHDERCLFST